MKPLTTVILPITLIFLTQGCKKDEPEPEQPKTELEKLPAATKKGMFTFGCLLNGKAWRASEVNYPNYVESTYKNGQLSISGRKHCPYIDIGPCDEQTIVFQLKDIDHNIPLDVGRYDLTSQSKNNPSVTFSTIGYSGSPNKFCIIDSGISPQNLLSGELEITNFNKSELIISGLFDFVLVSNCSDTIRVTNGRIDIRYNTY